MPRTKDPTLHTDLAKKQTFEAYQLVKKERDALGKKLMDLQREKVSLDRAEEQLRKSLNILKVSIVDGHDTTFTHDDDDGA